MAIRLTRFPDPQAASRPVTEILTYDCFCPDGLTKEVIARAAALTLLKGFCDAATLIQLHEQIEAVVAQAAATGTSIVNTVVKRIVSLNALYVAAGQSASDATAALAGAVRDVADGKPLAVADVTLPTGWVPESALFADAPGAAGGGTGGSDGLAGLDLLAPEFEPLRLALTRTLKAVRPEVYAKYRQIKDSGAATARADAYEFAFGVLGKLIERGQGQAGS